MRSNPPMNSCGSGFEEGQPDSGGRWALARAGRAMVKIRWDKTPKAARSKHAQVLADAYWKSPARIAKRRAVLVRRIAELQARLAELDAQGKAS